MEEAYKDLEQEAALLATKYSATRLKINTMNFDFDFKLGQDGNFNLVQVKAVIRVLGKTTKVPIGENEEYKTYAEAFSAVKKHWSEYYRDIRANRSPAQLKAEARRQKAYRERRKQKETELSRQQ